MNRYKTVDEYILGHPQWQSELDLLRSLAKDNNDLKEEVKWGSPVYTVGGKNVIGLGAFKSYVGIWFYQGVFLSDKQQKLINAQEGVTKAMRQWRFNSFEDIDPNLVKQYIAEAIKNQLAGKEIKPERKSAFLVPSELQDALDNNDKLLQQYKALTPYKQKEYCEYIETAKRAETKQSRIDKIIPLILSGIGLNDKYR